MNIAAVTAVEQARKNTLKLLVSPFLEFEGYLNNRRCGTATKNSNITN